MALHPCVVKYYLVQVTRLGGVQTLAVKQELDKPIRWDETFIDKF